MAASGDEEMKRDDNDTVRDRETVRVPMYLMDSVQRPLLSADAAHELRRSARETTC
jgi:hypothetical protein